VGKCDGYVIVKFEGADLKTEVKKNTYTPDWLEKMSIPVVLPTMADVITLQVNDWDKVRNR
jgi:Ca2+-dependent lipid-binding protein